MSVLSRTSRRIAKVTAIGALGVAVALGTTACGAGKISQTNQKETAINGANGTVVLSNETTGGKYLPGGSIAIRNLQVVYPVDKASEVFGDGGPFKLVFTIANDSSIRNVQLTGITAKQGQVQFKNDGASSSNPGQDGKITPNDYLTAGIGALIETDQAKKDGIERLDVEFSNTGDTVAAGLTVPLTFSFDVFDLGGKKVETKSITIDTPVDGTPLTERADVVREAQPEGEGGH